MSSRKGPCNRESKIQKATDHEGRERTFVQFRDGMEICRNTNAKAQDESGQGFKEDDSKTVFPEEFRDLFDPCPYFLLFGFLHQIHCSFLIKIIINQQIKMDKAIVVFVWILIFFLAIAYSLFFLPALLKYNLILFLIITIIFSIDFLLLIISYFRSTTQSPGYPSPSYRQNYTASYIQQIKLQAIEHAELKRLRGRKGVSRQKQIQLLSKTSYCFKCQDLKPPRTHHCRQCRKCILRMDHHCPWVGNCVGLQNHKYFILFLFYATLGCLMICLSIAIDFFTGEEIMNKMSIQEKRVLYGVCIASGLLSLSIGFLFVTQMITTVQNLTTLQSFTEGIQDNNPFSKGSAKKNMSEIFGKGCWLLPTYPFPKEQEQENSLDDSL